MLALWECCSSEVAVAALFHDCIERPLNSVTESSAIEASGSPQNDYSTYRKTTSPHTAQRLLHYPHSDEPDGVSIAYRTRSADNAVAEMLEDHSALLIVGPRATGKTTTSRGFAASAIRLGDPEAAQAFRADPSAILAELKEPILVDEWQEVPASLQVIKTAVDNTRRRGRFIVTGSVRGDLDAAT